MVYHGSFLFLPLLSIKKQKNKKKTLNFVSFLLHDKTHVKLGINLDFPTGFFIFISKQHRPCLLWKSSAQVLTCIVL